MMYCTAVCSLGFISHFPHKACSPQRRAGPQPFQPPAVGTTTRPVRSAAMSQATAASRKRPAETTTSNSAEEKRARERKRILRNRELARASNERRKGRIKAMETELEETRKTVAELEESIRTLEKENDDLKIMIERKTTIV